MKKRALKELIKRLRKDNEELIGIIRLSVPDFRTHRFAPGIYSENIKYDGNSVLTVKRITKPMTQMTERTKKVADFLKSNEGTFTPLEIDQKTGVSFRGIAGIMKTLTNDFGMTELQGRVVAKSKRMKMVAVPQI